MFQSNLDHCIFCFDTIICKLNNQKLPQYPQSQNSFNSPLFVTWKINNDQLRGCIGTFSSKSIDESLQYFALQSAFNDSRFSPITLNELSQLTVYVSLLINFENGSDAYDWNIGIHGIIISFEDNQRKYNGTFLPEVMIEQNWNKDETLKQLIRKTGKQYQQKGFNKNWKDIIPQIKLERYQSSKQKLAYADFIQKKQQN